MSARSTVAPSACINLAVASPSPLAAPVMTATLPETRSATAFLSAPSILSETTITIPERGAAVSNREVRPFRFSVQAFEAGSGRQWTDLARRAEDLGYSTLFTTDHYFGPGEISDVSGHRPVDVAPLTAMTAAAMATTRLRVGCRVFCVDYHNPVMLAKELATLDMLSGGRLEAGLGAGWVAAEYDGLGIAMDRPGIRIERLAETV